MSFQAFSSLRPPLVAAAGGAVLAGLPWAEAAAVTASSAVLQGANVTAFLLNCLAVSVPGRIDGPQDSQMRSGDLNPESPATTLQDSDSTTPLRHSEDYNETYSPARGRTLVSPSGWAFAIWGPIYLGETIFVGSQFLSNSGVVALLPQITAPFVAANIFQSLWCASFRPDFRGWASYVSPFMLAGTAYSLSQVHAVACTLPGSVWWYFLPLTMHFGWTSAATLVNLSGSVAMNPNNSDSLVTAVGHSSAIIATALGVGLTLLRSDPVYGFTLVWALSACADGMKKRVAAMEDKNNTDLKAAAKVQKHLCWAGAVACAGASMATFFL